MRTLVDLLNNDSGYGRIYAEADGFGYQISTYAPQQIADLFERMGGYLSIADASEAAQYQLSSIHERKVRRRRRG